MLSENESQKPTSGEKKVIPEEIKQYFFWLIREGNYESIIDLLSNPSYSDLVNAVDAQDRTALHHAVAVGNAVLVEILVKFGAKASLEKTDINGEKPIEIAINKYKHSKSPLLYVRIMELLYPDTYKDILSALNTKKSKKSANFFVDASAENLPKKVKEPRNKVFFLNQTEYEKYKNYILTIVDIANNLPTCNPEQKSKSLILLFTLLTNMPYKHARTNIEKTSIGRWENGAFLMKMGLVNLIDELKKGAPLEKLLTFDQIQSLEKDLIVVCKNFMKFYLQEEFLQKKDNAFIKGFQFLQNEIDELERKIQSIKVLNYSEEQKTIIKKNVLDLSTKKNRIHQEIMWLTEPDPVAKQKEILELHKAIIKSKEDRIKSLSAEIEKEKQVPKEKTTDTKKTSEELQKEKQKQIELKDKMEEHKNLSKEVIADKRKLENDIKNYSALIKTQKMLIDFSSKSLAEQKIIIDGLELKIKTIKDKVESLEKATDKPTKHDELVIYNKGIKELKQQESDMSKTLSELKATYEKNIFFSTVSIKTLDQRIELFVIKFKELQAIEKTLAEQEEQQSILSSIDTSQSAADLKIELESKIHELKNLQSQIIDKKQLSATLDKKLEIIFQSKLNTLQMTPEIFAQQMKKYKEWDKKRNAFRRKHSEEELKSNLEYQAIDKEVNKYRVLLKPLVEDQAYIDTNKAKAACELEIQEMEALERKSVEEISKLEKKYNAALDTEANRAALPLLEKELLQKKAFLQSYLESDINVSIIDLTSLKTFQIEYEHKHLEEILKTLKRRLEVADSNVTILAVIAEFTGWEKECCSENLKNLLLKIVHADYLKSFRGFRTRVVHALDDIKKIEHTMNPNQEDTIKNTKDWLLKIIDHLLLPDNLLFLTGKSEKCIAFTSDESSLQTVRDLEKSLMELSGNQTEEGERLAYSHNEQLSIFRSSIANVKNIIEVLCHELQNDLTSMSATSDPLNVIFKIMATPDNELKDNELKMKLKYDALMQAFGQAIGNLEELQQYTALVDFSELNANVANFPILNAIVHLAKDYRSSRTHNRYYDKAEFEALLTTISSSNMGIMKELDLLYSKGMLEFKNSQEITNILIYTQDDQLQKTNCIIS